MKSLKVLILVLVVKMIDGLPTGSEEVLYEPSEIASRTLDLWMKSGMVGNPEEQGPYLEGDIMVPEARNGVTSKSQLWDKATVPYELGASFSENIFL